MDTRNKEVFEAITSFVNDLWDVFQTNKPTPLALYNRMVVHINKEHSESGINDSISGFVTFFRTYEKYIIEDKLDSIARDTVIRYGKSEKVFLEIQKYIYQSSKDIEMRTAIRKHLLTISAILEPDIKKLEELDKKGGLGIDDSTREGKFITDIMKEAQNQMGDAEVDNPGQAMATLFSSVVPKLVVGLQHGVNSGEMDMYKLLGTMQTALGAMMPPPPPKEEGQSNEIEEVKEE